MDKPIQDKSDNKIQVISNRDVLKYKHNYKLTLDDQKEICLNHLFNKSSIKDTIKKFHISERTYYDVINKHKKNDFKILDEDINKLRKNFSKKTSILISKALDKIEAQLENDDIDINKLSTTLGILYDKESLELGKSTSNSAFNINIKIDK